MSQFNFHYKSFNAPPRSNLTIVQKLIATYKLWHNFLPHFPKTSRYTLGSKIDSLFIEITESVFLASYSKKQQKLSFILKASTKLDLLKFFFQIAWEIKAIDNKKYITLSERLDEIGKMLGGWNKQIQKTIF
ncbi:MAG: four helix bundle protein [Candidatus Pacebacteria bacterium]|nr:four helix bundle protein [Candidatus Paceibacterota bacterium]